MTTFQRSLAVSLGIHVLIFGTALAFAHFGEALFIFGARVITVDLVGDGGRRASGRGPAVPRAPVTDVIPAMPEHEAKENSLPAALPAESVGTGQVPSGNGDPGGSSAVGDAGAGIASHDAGGPEGTLSSEQWRMLQSALDKAKTYPRFARERGIEGTVLIRFKVLPSGDIEGVNVVKSSGAAVLDEASVRTVYRAAPMPYVKGWVEVPMVYELK